jgi:hypothetical protein
MNDAAQSAFEVCESMDAVIVVSGLPRSGTSMMMRMLEAGGVPVVTDQIRKADASNPRGYYELERVKRLKEDSGWVKDCRGKVLKIISTLLYYLPEGMFYKVLIMQRDLDEILASQSAMLKRLGRELPPYSGSEMAEKYRRHLEKLEQYLKTRGDLSSMSVDYNEVISDPLGNAMEVNRFLNERLNTEAMVRAVERSLYRQRRAIGDGDQKQSLEKPRKGKENPF